MTFHGCAAALLAISSIPAALAQLPTNELPERARDVVAAPDAADSGRINVTWTSPHEYWWPGNTGADPELTRAILEEAGIGPDENGEYVWGGPCLSTVIAASPVPPDADIATWFGQAATQGGPAPSDPGSPESGFIGGLAGGTLHYVVIRSTNSDGLHSYSDPVSATTLLDLIAPATIDAPVVVNTTPESIGLEWIATGDDGLIGQAALFRVYRSEVAAITGASLSDPSTVLAGTRISRGPAGTRHSFTVAGLTAQRHYHFAVVAVDEAGNPGPVSTNNPEAWTTAFEPKQEEVRRACSSAGSAWPIPLAAALALLIRRR